MSISNKKNLKKEEAIKSLDKGLEDIFERLVAEYQYHCILRYGRPFVSYAILADLVNGGWRPSHEEFLNPETLLDDYKPKE